MEGLRAGVWIGHNPAKLCKGVRTNCRSAYDHPEVIDRYLSNELVMGRVAGPFADSLVPGVMISRFGVLPKSGQPGKWHLIVDLLAPSSASVNDGISTVDSGMAYSSVADVARVVLQLGQGTEMAKWTLQVPSGSFLFTLLIGTSLA